MVSVRIREGLNRLLRREQASVLKAGTRRSRFPRSFVTEKTSGACPGGRPFGGAAGYGQYDGLLGKATEKEVRSLGKELEVW